MKNHLNISRKTVNILYGVFLLSIGCSFGMTFSYFSIEVIFPLACVLLGICVGLELLLKYKYAHTLHRGWDNEINVLMDQWTELESMAQSRANNLREDEITRSKAQSAADTYAFCRNTLRRL